MPKLRKFIEEVTELAASDSTRNQQHEQAAVMFEKFLGQMRNFYAQESSPTEHVRSDLGRLEDELVRARKGFHQSNPAHGLLGHVHDLARNARNAL